MRYILVMTFSGSVMTLLYCGIKAIGGRRLSGSWRYLLVKATMLYFLIPMPFLKKGFLKLAEMIGPAGGAGQAEITAIFRYNSTLFFDGKNYYINDVMKWKLLTVIVWALLAACIILYKTVRYLKMGKRVRDCCKVGEEEKLLQIKQAYGIRRKVQCYRYGANMAQDSGGEQSAFTFGLINPVVVLADGGKADTEELALRHEMEHIKRFDIFWKILMSCVMAFHCCNPIVWWLNRELDKVCEMSCDEAVLKNESDAVKQKYMELMIDMAKKDAASGKYCWSAGLSREGKIIKERIMNIKQEKKYWKKWVSAAVVVFAVLLNSLTALAYETVQVFDGDKLGVSQLGTPEAIFEEDFLFIFGTVDMTSDEIPDTFREIKIMYELQFTDENGEIHPVKEEAETYAVCKHTYAYGIVDRHVKSSDGGCTIVRYDAKECTKCSDAVLGEEINQITYKVCPHKILQSNNRGELKKQ